MQTRAKVDGMAHLHSVYEDIHLPSVLLIPEEEALMPMQGVKVFVASIAQFCEQGFGFGAVP